MTTMLENSPLDIAIKLANQGIYVYPLYPGSKVPPKGGEYNATISVDTINGWFAENTDTNLGVNLQRSNLVVIDLDQHGTGNNGIISWSNYLKNNGPRYMNSLRTYIEATPRHGFHIFYKSHHDFNSKDITLLPGVELLTGKVMIAPSFIKEIGKNYTPQYSNQPYLILENLLDLPEWITDLAQRAKERDNSFSSSSNFRYERKLWAGKMLDDICKGAPTGERHNWLCHVIGMLKHSGADTRTAYDQALFANQHCDSPLPEKEVEDIFVSLFQKGA